MIKIVCRECGKEHHALNRDEVPECDGCKLAKSRLYFEIKWNSGGSFYHNLCEAIAVSDANNLVNLHKSFPELTEGYISYSQGKTWGEFLATSGRV